ncbi:MAG: OmpA family protein [Candidatus Scalindua rubra]|uniref:H+-driven flagellar motor component MotB n=1 Tax=Candidatus Scalindua brodae TaxID=237368 RepID=A0A0B0EST1_9BACT|nr:MAG: H+-driven flagellar motor component MotB [Candidatus Scalindua brodae]MBZ0107224.1 OmpA family protein [Candidatus Scalindua rubra]TWU31663.1 Outer membrane protein Omp38 precursor [Candidatus Brocadiaceae bacterium S225]
MEEEPKKDPNEWALAYGDMITLLMTFFVLIIAMSSPKTDDEPELIMKKSTGTGENLMVATLKESGIFKDKVKSKSKTEIDEDDLLPPINDLELIREDMIVFMTENELFNVIDLLKTEEGFTIRIMADILFDSGDISLKVEYLYLLDKIAELLGVIPNNVRIEGHTDDRYSDDGNTGNTLSIARASRVCDYIIGEEMLLSSRFGVTGHGWNRPLFPNTNEHNRTLNRRVEVIIKEIPRGV